MYLSEQAETILERLWAEKESGRKFDEAPSDKVIKELVEKGAVERQQTGALVLTESGLNLARDAVRRHRLAERLMTDVLAVKSSMVHETACHFEHHLHKGIDTNVCTLLGHPKFCPHGSPIPPGKCCAKAATTVTAAVSALSNMNPGQGGHVAYLHTGDTKRAQMLISMGIIPGAEIKLLAKNPSFLFQLGEGQFAVDATIAANVYIRLN